MPASKAAVVLLAFRVPGPGSQDQVNNMLARFTTKAHQYFAEQAARLSDALQQHFPATAAFMQARLPGYIQLTRLNRPIGILLLLWPTLAALWLAAGGWPDWSLLFIFVLGTVLMRSAGCCINDYADSAIDGAVARTQARPLVTGALTRREALLCFLVLCSAAFVLLLFTNRLTILLSVGAVAVAAL
jgi:4-hydroxybenzoate polyprenyltransferase